MKIIKGVTEMRSLAGGLRDRGEKIVFVPTMGFLHGGHRELLKRGRMLAGSGGSLVLSIFVNPAQFGPKEDYKSYPRDLEKDLKIAEEAGVDIVFTPLAEEMYPGGFETYVEVTDLSKYLCGEFRPGHFKGVATIVLKLFNIVMPHTAVFGLKDYQQFVIIKKMAFDLNLAVGLVGVETFREADGLAMSSRNSYLGPEERTTARCIPEALKAAREAFTAGERIAGSLVEKMKKIIEKEPKAVIEYIKVCHRDTLKDLDVIEKDALAALAVRIGRTRLIDNCILE